MMILNMIMMITIIRMVMMTPQVLGAVGVSGAAGDEDEFCALAGALGAGLDLSTEPPTHSVKI
jgi:hypothetical protein